MKSARRLLSVVFLPVLATTPIVSQAQTGPDSHLPSGSSGTTDHESAALMGKVVMEESSETYPVDTVVTLQCGNQERASANVDRRGQFTLALGGVTGSALGARAS